jgi:predicted permease
MDFWALLLAAVLPIVRVVLIWAIGAVLATKRLGIITPAGRHVMSQLVFNVFSPALLLEKLIKTLTPRAMLLWWPVPFFVALNILIGLCVGFVAGRFLKVGPALGVFVACVAIGNYGNLPLVLIPALCTDPHSPLHVVPDCVDTGIAYVMFGAWVGSLAAWTVAWVIMRPPGTYQDLELNAPAESDTIAPGAVSPGPQPPSVGNTPSTPGARRVSFWARLRQPPLIATALAFIVSAIPGARGVLFDPGGVLRPVGGCLETLSGGTIPMIMLLLGSSLSRGTHPSSLPPSAIAVVVGCRLLLTPVVGMALVFAAEAAQLLDPRDAILRMVVMLHQCTPGAAMLNTIANLHQYEVGTTSLLLFWQYILYAPVLTLYIMAFFWLYGDTISPVGSNSTAVAVTHFAL